MNISARAQRIEPFYVMEMAKAATQLAKRCADSDSPMIFLNIGEPDFTAPPLVQEAAHRAIRDGKTQYTAATGLPELRERISDWYAGRFGLNIAAERIVVTAGASAALQLACLTLIEAGDDILMPDPCYPCNRQFVSAADGKAVLIPASAKDRFQLNAELVKSAWTPNTRGVLLASPSNPTGTSIEPGELRRIHEVVSEHDGITMLDEIYLGLSFDERFSQSALAIDENIISINSFSKYFSMTGWRLGWLVVPPSLVTVVERLAQNLFICPSTVAQYAALACFEPESLAEFELRRRAFKERRDFFIPALNDLGLTVPVMPDGAFYAWADCSQACQTLAGRLTDNISHHSRASSPVMDSWGFAAALMEHAHLAVTPGRDFGPAHAGNFIRFSTASGMPQLREAVARLKRLL
jgi:aspartate/methionine/tyrosine aminotransferase